MVYATASQFITYKYSGEDNLHMVPREKETYDFTSGTIYRMDHFYDDELVICYVGSNNRHYLGRYKISE